MNNITYLDISFGNIMNLILGITLGFFVMIILTCAIISKKFTKKNENIEIRKISNISYNDYYLKNVKMNDKLISSLLFEVKEVSKLIYEDKKYPLYELSINDLINALTIIQKRLKSITSHPLCQDLKHVHIATILSVEENITRPLLILYNNKITKVFLLANKLIRIVLNIFNPIYYIKRIITYFTMKRGKKDLILIVLDYIGNTTYEIYNHSKEKGE